MAGGFGQVSLRHALGTVSNECARSQSTVAEIESKSYQCADYKVTRVFEGRARGRPCRIVNDSHSDVKS